MPISTQWWLPLELPLLPNQLIIRIQDDEVIDVRRRNEVLLSSCTGIYTPAAEEDDVGAADVGGVTVSWERWSTGDSHSCPFVFLCV